MIGSKLITYSEYVESITIFAKYSPAGLDSPAEVYCAHNEMWMGPNSHIVSDEDTARLESLGWQVEPEGSFHRFL